MSQDLPDPKWNIEEDLLTPPSEEELAAAAELSKHGRDAKGRLTTRYPARARKKSCKIHAVRTFMAWATPQRVLMWLDKCHEMAMEGHIRALELLISRAVPEELVIQVQGEVMMSHDHRHLHVSIPESITPDITGAGYKHPNRPIWAPAPPPPPPVEPAIDVDEVETDIPQKLLPL